MDIESLNWMLESGRPRDRCAWLTQLVTDPLHGLEHAVWQVMEICRDLGFEPFLELVKDRQIVRHLARDSIMDYST